MGDARRRKRAGLPKFQKPEPTPPRTPEQIEKELAADNRFYGRIDAAIDFIHAASEDALRKQARQLLRSQS